MASKDSDKLDPKNDYGLGNYEFSLEIDDTTGGPAIEVTARCKDTKTGIIATTTKQFDKDIEISGWYVETNETEASVYIVVNSSINAITWALGNYTRNLYLGPYQGPVVSPGKGWGEYYVGHGLVPSAISVTQYKGRIYAARIAGAGKNNYFNIGTENGIYSSWFLSNTYTALGDDVSLFPSVPVSTTNPAGKSPTAQSQSGEYLVARFSIDVEKAGGTGEDSDWDDPEDYDPEEDPIEWGDPDYPDPEDPDYPDPIEWGDPDYPDPEDPDYPDPIYPDDPDYPDPEDPDYPGDQDGDGEPDPYHPDYHPDYYPPTKTLYLTVTGATSGTHESGITAAPNEIAADYGCGGNGGHGGGGGAGSSTVVIHKFATSKANSKEVTAISRPHGYGSGGGKGGKGGDGCILVYY